MTDLGCGCILPEAIGRRSPVVDLVVIGGGDGTLDRAGKVLMEIDRPVGILPLDTANNLARSLGLPLDPLSTCRAMAKCASLPMHPGPVNGAPFFTAAHVGLGARINRRLSVRGKERWGILAHLLAAAGVLKSRRSFSASICHDAGQKTLAAVEIAVGVARYFGPGLPVDEEAIRDRRFHVFLLKRQSLAGLIAKIPALVAGRIGFGPRAERFRTAELYLESDRPAHISADGEIIQQTPARFKISTEPVRFMSPPGSCKHARR